MRFILFSLLFVAVRVFAVQDENPDQRPWTLVVIPDTQHYTADWRKAPYEHMITGFQWIIDSKESLNIKMVQGLGDIVQDWDSRTQWNRGEKAWNLLRGHVLYMPVAGNHDDPDSFNQRFPALEFTRLPWWGSCYQDARNSYFTMKLSGRDYMFLQVQSFDQYSNHDFAALMWAEGVIQNHPNHRVILATHDMYSTSIIRNRLLSKFDNIVLANAGHSCVREKYFKERNAHSFIVDYQCDSREVFFIRYYTFYPNSSTVKFKTYSPVLNSFETDSESDGVFHIGFP